MEQSDATAVAQVRDGDSDAFRVLVERHSHHVFRLAFRMTGNEQDAEDLVQETFLRAYRQIAKFDGRASFSTWLYRIAANCSLDLIRLRKRRQEQQVPVDEQGLDLPATTVSEDPTPDRLAFSGELQQLLGPALGRLSSMERAAFVLRHYEGMCMEDIGRALGVHSGAAKHSVFRAVQKLRRAIETRGEYGKMKHLNQDDLILEYYGERREESVRQHLEECQTCRANFESLALVLNALNQFEAPEPRAGYGGRVWNRIAPHLSQPLAPWYQRWGYSWLEPRRLVAACAVLALIVGAFLAGRVSQRRQQVAGLPGPVRERIMLVAVGEHLERSQMILVELVNNESKGPVDISGEQQRAEDLIGENRLYRQAALKSGDKAISNVLDELERVLLDIAHSPSKVDSAELDQIRQRIEGEGILFKIRVVGSNLKDRERPPISTQGGRAL